MKFPSSLLVLLIVLRFQSAVADTTDILPMGPFLKTVKITHHPHEIMFFNRAYDIELFVEFPTDSVATVSLFFQIDSMITFQEVIMPNKRGRYTYHIDPSKAPGGTLTYFFVVRLKNYAVFATPLDSEGYLKPVKKIFVDPVAYFRWKRSQNR